MIDLCNKNYGTIPCEHGCPHQYINSEGEATQINLAIGLCEESPSVMVTVCHIPLRTPMSDYDFRPGGSLKLKGVADGGVTKKCVRHTHDNLHVFICLGRKKKSSKSKDKDKADKARIRLQQSALDGADKRDTPSGSSRNSPAINGGKTEAERRFEEMQQERVRIP